ncbi:MAG: FecR family protein [Candidatus Wallbacteria bacterium]|nr:FecR family protein [Candidatus Wallbacteria bacterium]
MKLLHVIAFLFLTASLMAGEALPEIELFSSVYFFEGGVYAKSAGSGDWSEISQSQELMPGDAVKTGEDGKATIILADSAIVRISPLSEFLIPENLNVRKKISFIEMLRGVLWARAKKDDDSLRVATPNAICGVRGTEFLVEILGEDATEFNVMDGVVEVKSKDDAFAGSLLLRVAEGTMVRRGRKPDKILKNRPGILSGRFKDFERISPQMAKNAAKKAMNDLDRLEKLLREEK